MQKGQGLYIISVASQILELHPQTLRKYERAGFVEPPRLGVLRLYSEEDIARLRIIKHFVEELGLNLAGVELALKLTQELLALRKNLASGETSKAAREQALQQVESLLDALGVSTEENEPDGARGRRG